MSDDVSTFAPSLDSARAELHRLTLRLSSNAARAALEGFGRNEESSRALMWDRVERGNQLTRYLARFAPADGGDFAEPEDGQLVSRFWRAERKAIEVL